MLKDISYKRKETGAFISRLAISELLILKEMKARQSFQFLGIALAVHIFRDDDGRVSKMFPQIIIDYNRYMVPLLLEHLHSLWFRSRMSERPPQPLRHVNMSESIAGCLKHVFFIPFVWWTYVWNSKSF